MVYLLLTTEIIYLFFVLYFFRGDFMSPATVTITMFCISTICVIYNVDYWEVHFSVRTYVYLSLSLLFIIFIELIIMNLSKNPPHWGDLPEFGNISGIFISPILNNIIIIVSFIALLYYIFEIYKEGGKANLLTNIAIVKLDDDIKLNIIAKIAYRFLRIIPYPYLYIFMYNFIVGKQSIKYNAKLLFPILIGIIAIFFSGGRAPILYIILSATFYAVIFTRIQVGWKNKEIRQIMKKFILFLCSFLIIFVSTRSIMKGKKYDNSVSSIIEYFTYYVGGSQQLFDKIVDDTSIAYPKRYETFGAYTFASFWQNLYEWGLIHENINLNDCRFIPLGGKVSYGGNVYTIFSAPYNDFGIVGMLLYIMLFYAVFDFIYYNKIKYAKYTKRTFTCIFIYGYFVYMVFVSFFITPTITLKIQTFIEVFLMVLMMKILVYLKVKFRRNS